MRSEANYEKGYGEIVVAVRKALYLKKISDEEFDDKISLRINSE